MRSDPSFLGPVFPVCGVRGEFGAQDVQFLNRRLAEQFAGLLAAHTTWCPLPCPSGRAGLGVGDALQTDDTTLGQKDATERSCSQTCQTGGRHVASRVELTRGVRNLTSNSLPGSVHVRDDQ